MSNKFLLAEKIIGVAIVVFLIMNIFVIDYVYFFANSQKYEAVTSNNLGKDNMQGSISAEKQIADSCYPYSCVELIRQATQAATNTQVNLVQSSTGSREYYIPLGTGQTVNDQYENVPGFQAYIDSTKYGDIQQVTFEVSLQIPTANGTVYAQLYNVTDQHPVWYSEVSSQGNSASIVISKPVQLGVGNKLYQVQMKTTMQYQSIANVARVHIISK